MFHGKRLRLRARDRVFPDPGIPRRFLSRGSAQTRHLVPGTRQRLCWGVLLMESTEKALLEKIREARFACIELRIYLDTHPDDAIAQADYLAYSEKLQLLITKYESQYGPLMNFGQSPTDVGSWVYQKWPWDL